MGTKVQSKRYLSGYHSIWGSNESVNNDILSLYHEGRALKNYHHYDPVLPNKWMMSGHLGYDKEGVRQLILEHESIFRHQLRELHRLYGRQREIMNEFKRREVKNGQMEPETSHSSSFLPVSSGDTKSTWHVSHTSLLHSLLNQASVLQKSSLPSFRKEETMLGPFPYRVEGSSEKCEPPNSNDKLLRNRMFDLEQPADLYMNDDVKKIENNFCGLPGIERVSKTYIDENASNKDINHQQNGDGLWSNLCPKRNNQLADLNEPIPLEENSVLVIMEDSGAVASTLADTGREQLRIDRKATAILSNEAHPSARDACFKDFRTDLRRNELSTSDHHTAKSTMKRKLFGVDIFEIDDKQMGTDAFLDKSNLISDKRYKGLQSELPGKEYLPKSFDGSACLNWKSTKVSKTTNKFSNVIQDAVIPGHHIVSAGCQNEQNNSKGSLLCCSGTQHCDQQVRTNKNSHHLNMDSLQYNCPQFFQKSKITPFPSSQIWVQKQEMTSQHLVQDTEQGNIAVDGHSNIEMTNCFSVSNSKEQRFTGISSKEICGVDINESEHLLVDRAISKDEPKAGDLDLEERVKNGLSGLREHIDLNLSLIEDGDPSAPSPPSTIVKISRTEIDLEAPVILESEADTETNLSADELEKPNEELLKVAAEAIVAISLSSSQGTLIVATAEPMEAAASDNLSWLAELVCSYESNDSSNELEFNTNSIITEELVPVGMDYFEFMTLRLKDTKEDNYHYKPKNLENEDESDEETKVPTVRGRPRRGQAKKGRQRKDFRRDILPGLVTLSKLEMVEDFQTLEEMFKSSGREWPSSLVRKAGKGSRRRRSSNAGVSPPPRESNAISRSLEQQPLSIEEKALCGWGKRTRRLPRQRYTNGSDVKLNS